MNWTDTKEKGTPMWMKTYEKFKNYILMRNKQRRKEKRQKKKKSYLLNHMKFPSQQQVQVLQMRKLTTSSNT